MKQLLLICFILSTQFLQSKNNTQYGLSFNAYEVEKEERTSLNLTSEGNFSFPDGFIMEFDVSFRRAQYSFGYIFRIIGQGGKHIDLLLNSVDNSMTEQQLTAIYQSGQILCNKTFEDLGANFNEWITVKAEVDSNKGIFKLSLNKKEFEINDDYFRQFGELNIVFGKNNDITYQTSDVSAMSVRDIEIKNLKGDVYYHWPLAQHVHDGAYDRIKNRFAFCEKPNWLMDRHCFWRERASFTTEIHPDICLVPRDNAVAIADKHTLYLYTIADNAIKKTPHHYGSPIGSNANQVLYSELEQKIFAYNFTDEIVWYNSADSSWTNDKGNSSDPVYWHHNRFFSAKDTALYTFGGYGFHFYKNDINKYHFPTKTWSKSYYKGETTIAPRYLSGLGVLDDNTVLLFGGYGSEKGSQELSPHNYYDLYSYNTETSEAHKIWELNQIKHNFVVANSLVIDTLANCFYALCFPHHKYNTTMQLYRFSLTEPSFEILADSIPFLFSDNHSYADLYLSPDKKELIAVTSHTDDKSEKATVSIFTLAFPALNKVDLLQKGDVEDYSMLYSIGITIALLFLLLLYIIGKRRRGSRSKTVVEAEEIQMQEESANVVANEPVMIKTLSEKPAKQSILLLGGFQVIDKESEIVTREFTPILKQLFLLILLYTLKDGKGISSVKLREILWFDKTSESAKNNRGVSLSKLRFIFEKIGEISISGRNSYWVVSFGENIYCDYYEVLILMERLSVSPTITDIKRLVTLASAGELLPNLQTDWVDPFKSNFSNKLIDLLLSVIANSEKLGISQAMMIDIADTIFVHDSLNEDALKIKCTLLVKMGKNGLAQKAYSSFAKEYQSLFGDDFNCTFEQVTS